MLWDILGELLIPLLLEGLAQAAAEILLELGWVSLKASIGRERDAPAVVAWLGLFVLGAAAGGLSLWVWPYRLTSDGPFPGVSLIVSPVLNGLVLDTFGRWRRRHGQPATHASTFWGGAIFALGIALVRFLLVPGFPSLPLER